MDLGAWLQGLGLERYEAVFRENEIDDQVLPNLTAEDLKELGVAALGHRRILLDAIASLSRDNSGKGATTLGAPNASHEDRSERRQVTVMFCDLMGSTALSARLDVEDLRDTISTYEKCVGEIVSCLGGFVAQFTSDGFLAYYGYPLAHEDDAERAVRAGLELIAAVSSLETPSPLQIRVGIATGLVVAGELVGLGEEGDIVGETPNLAARLQGIAEPNTVIIAEGMRNLLGDLFELEESRREGAQGYFYTSASLRGAATGRGGEPFRGFPQERPN